MCKEWVHIENPRVFQFWQQQQPQTQHACSLHTAGNSACNILSKDFSYRTACGRTLASLLRMYLSSVGLQVSLAHSSLCNQKDSFSCLEPKLPIVPQAHPSSSVLQAHPAYCILWDWSKMYPQQWTVSFLRLWEDLVCILRQYHRPWRLPRRFYASSEAWGVIGRCAPHRTTASAWWSRLPVICQHFLSSSFTIVPTTIDNDHVLVNLK